MNRLGSGVRMRRSEHTYYGLLNVRREFVLTTGRTTTVRSTTLRRRDNKDLIFSGRLKTGLLAIP